MKKALFLSLIQLLLCQFGLLGRAEPNSPANQLDSAPRAENSFEETLKRAEDGDLHAQFSLGVMYYTGQGIEQDYKEAFKWFTKAAEQGNAAAQYNLGLMYAKGQGVEQDYKQAIKWYTKAADQGDAAAQYSLGTMYYTGQDIKQDYKQALKWYTKAAEQGNVAAQALLGLMYDAGWGIKDYKQAFKWYSKAAEQGEAVAQLFLGLMYDKGRGVKQDYKQAFNWYSKAAEQGVADGQYNLGVMYAEGRGVEQDYKQALKWFTKAAEQGVAAAQYNLGVMYWLGRGVVEDFVESYKWLLLAGMNGQDVSKAKDLLKKQMTPAQIATAQQKAKEYSDRRQKADEKHGPQVAHGTGFFISSDGLFLTAAHVLEGSASERVIWQGRTFSARRVLVDKNLDLAVLKVVGLGPFSCLPVVSSAGVKLGDTVFTVGFPLVEVQGSQAKYTEGTISALTGIGDEPKLFQVSVPVQPGNSGGPLLDSKGRVVGIIVSRLDDLAIILATGSTPQNVNYALKASFVLSLLESIPDVVGNLEKARAVDKSAAIEQAKQAVAIVVGEQTTTDSLDMTLEELTH